MSELYMIFMVMCVWLARGLRGGSVRGVLVDYDPRPNFLLVLYLGFLLKK